MARQNHAQFSLDDLVRGCAENTALFRSRHASDPRYCYELFRRALAEGDQRAWNFVYRQYSPTLARWVTRHPSFRATTEEPQYFANRALERMWSAISPGFPFDTLAQALRYLQMCVHSVILDHARAAEQRTIHAQADIAVGLERVVGSVTEHPTAEIEARDFWALIDERLHDERERAVMRGSYVVGLKPRELVQEYAELFDDVRQVYRIKENVIARLRRDELLKKLLADA